MLVRSILIVSVSSILLVGCSGLIETTRKTLNGDDSKRKSVKKEERKFVSKDQYDDLLAKYKNLNDKYQGLKEERLTNNQKSYDQLDELVSSGGSQASAMPKSAAPTGQIESIDVFGGNGASAKPKTSTPGQASDNSNFEDDLSYYKKSLALMENRKLDEALKVFQYLENSKSNQIMVRAKRYIGDIYLDKKQFDLALQVYESIIRKHAFSGSVIHALKKAAICSDRLGLTDKKLKYESILRDFFEVQV